VDAPPAKRPNAFLDWLRVEQTARPLRASSVLALRLPFTASETPRVTAATQVRRQSAIDKHVS
jgi:hypothetical protein